MKPIWDAEKAAAKEAANRESMLSLAAAAGVKVQMIFKQCFYGYETYTVRSWDKQFLGESEYKIKKPCSLRFLLHKSVYLKYLRPKKNRVCARPL